MITYCVRSSSKEGSDWWLVQAETEAKALQAVGNYLDDPNTTLELESLDYVLWNQYRGLAGLHTI